MPGSIERVRAWAEVLNRRRGEVVESLRAEGITVESVFLDRADDGDFLVYYVRGHDLAAARAVTEASARAIDREHEEFKAATWESRRELELLFDSDLA